MPTSHLRVKQHNKFIWDPTCVTNFESIYSILSKFVQQNYALTHDIWRIFGDNLKSNKQTNSYIPRLNLNYENRLNPFLLDADLDIDQNTYEFSRVFPYLPRLRYGRNFRKDLTKPMFKKAIHDELRYCPICLESQYHTPLFQLKWIHTCPVHKVALQTCCQHCGQAKPYKLESRLFKTPFGCNCRESFIKHSFDSKKNKKLSGALYYILFNMACERRYFLIRKLY